MSQSDPPDPNAPTTEFPAVSGDEDTDEDTAHAHVRCIAHTHVDRKGTAWCGRTIEPFEWFFQGVEHAVYSLMNEDLVQACPSCLNVLRGLILPNPPLEPNAPDSITTTFKNCARCGQNHVLTCTKLAKPIYNPNDPEVDESKLIPLYTHWGLCPTTAEPVLFTIYADPTPSRNPAHPASPGPQPESEPKPGPA